jgi:hypothetical protein
MKVYTADNVTNEEIISLGQDPRSSLQTAAWCIEAMRMTRGSKKAEAQRMRARARVAEILNARDGR